MCADFVAPGGNHGEHWEILWDDLQKILEKEFTNSGSGCSMIFHIYVCSRVTIWENMIEYADDGYATYSLYDG